MKHYFYFIPAFLLIIIITSCSYLTESRPILKQSDYEKMIAGRIDAEYVGTNNCLFKCHAHDKLADFFKKSVHSEQMDKETLLPLVNCETCHGPGSIALANIKEVNGKKQCDFESLIKLAKLPAGAKNLSCLKCHAVSSSPSLALWRGSAHDLAGVSCSDCHKLHVSPFQKIGHNEQSEMCMGCHKKVKSEISNLSHHPIKENKVVCSDCHDPHGSVSDKLLKEEPVRELCGRCHMEKSGPFVFEHADLMDDCRNCHKPHGSINDNLLKMREPILCLKCHEGHHYNPAVPGSVQGLSSSNKAKYYNRCTDCHLTIHGTNQPNQRMVR